ncbi:MAG: aromatic amino acid aminotransferase [Rhizobiales bacterium 65-79]|jgi:aromatic-amino-acid transaminase|nr:aspartate/tyrosine/aromatic aminotransferase [Hyphomicrobiales bacterium]OJU06146.1 MAG: aromatic amino acid aminotransferase [Rhizobiales bacterium 65-79]
MFEMLTAAPPDKIIALMGQFREDPRPGKIDLGVGVYKDAKGDTPIMAAVREAEKLLYERQSTKTYVGMAGDPLFNAAMIGLVFGDGADRARIRAAQAPGGSGALRILAELIARSKGTTVWLSDPTWPNHVPLIRAAGVTTRDYPYFDAATGTVRFDAMIAALKGAAAGDIVLLHGCCHNPTGANLDHGQWEAVADLLVSRGLFPFVDLAYQGFGDGLEEDAFGVRLLASRVPEMAVAASCSKNFAVYRDRVGTAFLLGRNPAEADIAFSQLLSVARGMYSMPPDHAAAAIRIVLEDGKLTESWKSELESMRRRMVLLREGFADALRRQSNSDRFDFIARHRGMFSRIGATPAQVEKLRKEYGVYMVGDSRINVAGLPEDRLDTLAASIVSVMAEG